MSAVKCPFTGLACDGGTVDIYGTVGCAYKRSPEGECAWTRDVPGGVSPRDFYNQSVMDAMTR